MIAAYHREKTLRRNQLFGALEGVLQHGPAARQIYVLLGKVISPHLADERSKPSAVATGEYDAAANRQV